jgi:hypothetical protein
MRHALALTLGVLCSRSSIALSPTAPSSRMLDDYLHAEFTRLGVHRLNIVSIRGCYLFDACILSSTVARGCQVVSACFPR